jgi:hypothetical protein
MITLLPGRHGIYPTWLCGAIERGASCSLGLWLSTFAKPSALIVSYLCDAASIKP